MALASAQRPRTAGLPVAAGQLRGWLLAALLLPMLWPALHALGGTLHTLWLGHALAGGGSLWPGERVAGLLGQGLLLALLAAGVATAVAALCAAALLLPLARGTRWLLVAGLAASFCFGTVVHLLAWRAVFPVVTGGVAGWALATLALGLRFAPLAAALLVTGLASFERAEMETALSTGGPRALWAVARTRLLRLAGMCMAAVAALVFCESELPPLVGVHVYAEEFLSQVALEPDPHVAAALGWPLMALALACAALLSGLPRLRPGAAGAVQLGWLGQWAHAPAPLRRGLPAVALMLVALPLLLLALGSVQASGRWPAHAGAALRASLAVATLSALLACAWGWGLAALASQAGATARRALNLLAWLAMLWPSALTGLAIAGAALPPALGEATPLVLAHTLRLLPFAAWVMLALHDTHPQGPREQLRTLGAHGWVAWRHVTLPAAVPGLVAAFVLGFGLSLAELTATVLTVPPGMETVILRLYNLLHYGDQRGVMLMALLQGLTVAGAVVLAMALPPLLQQRTRGAMLRLDHLVVRRPGGFTVQVQGLVLAPGARVTLIGPSGGGKSTLLRSLVGLEPQAELRGLHWHDDDISAAPPHRRPFGWLPQELGLWPQLSALAHVAFARTRGRSSTANEADTQVLAQLGLAHRAQALPAQLSGGERQRLAFARVIALQPAWAVLDEPFSHLDPVMAHELSAAFQALAARLGMGLIQVTHQLHAPAADELFWALEGGSLTQAGRWAELQTQPATPWIQRFVALQPLHSH